MRLLSTAARSRLLLSFFFCFFLFFFINFFFFFFFFFLLHSISASMPPLCAAFFKLYGLCITDRLPLMIKMQSAPARRASATLIGIVHEILAQHGQGARPHARHRYSFGPWKLGVPFSTDRAASPPAGKAGSQGGRVKVGAINPFGGACFLTLRSVRAFARRVETAASAKGARAKLAALPLPLRPQAVWQALSAAISSSFKALILF